MIVVPELLGVAVYLNPAILVRARALYVGTKNPVRWLCIQVGLLSGRNKTLTIRFFGKILKGKFFFNRRQVMEAYVSGRPDGDYYIEFHKCKGPAKTLKQNAYYYGVIIPHTMKALKEHGNETLVVSVGEKFKELPLIKEVVDIMLKTIHAETKGVEVKSKTDFSMEDYSDLIDVSIRWAAQHLGYVIPPPDTENFKDET